MKRTRVVEETVMVPVPRASLTVAAPPATVTQKTSLAVFGIPPRKYLELAACGAFPVKEEGKLRVARYADVERYLTTDAKVRRAPRPANEGPPPAPKQAEPSNADLDASLRKAGLFVPPSKR